MTDLRIDDATLRAAELLLGVQYTAAEHDQMRDNLAAQIDLAIRRRALKLANSLAPASTFDPRLPGFSMPAQSALNVPRTAPALPAADEDIAFAPVRCLSAWIAAGQLSSVRLTKIYLDRIRRHDPALFSFATVTADTALARARHADALLAAGTWLGPLHGIPYAAKDILAATACGTPTRKSFAAWMRPAPCCSARPASARSPTATSGTAAPRAIPGTPRKAPADPAPARPPPPPPASPDSRSGPKH
jgi:hypothetical protein